MAEPLAYYVRTDKDTHFTQALATNAIESETLTHDEGVRSPVGDVGRITLYADQNLDFDVILFRSAPGDLTDLDTLDIVDWISFLEAEGVQIAGAGPFIYSQSGMKWRYAEALGRRELHVGLVNRHATAKNAGATGEVVIEFEFTVAGADLPSQTPETFRPG